MKVSLGVERHGQVKIWDVYNRRNVKRTYMGHAAGVRWVAFSSDGKTFLSASFDRNIKLWDTESGKCIGFLENDVYSDVEGKASVDIVTKGVLLIDRAPADAASFIGKVPGITFVKEATE